MPLIVYLDETGDHSLSHIDKDFPIFVLTMFVVDSDEYIHNVVPLVNRLKFDYFGHEGVILHSRDIRKAQNDFRFLQLADARQPFYARLNAVLGTSKYEIIAVAIRKAAHKRTYGASSEDPYDFALKQAMERLMPVIDRTAQMKVTILAEARGKNEDNALRLSFLQLTTAGTEQITADRFRDINWRLTFVPKAMNIVGHQLADLIGYPIARHVIDPGKPNPAFEVIQAKFCAGVGLSHGLVILP